MCKCGCESSSITSTRGPKGDPGPQGETGGVYEEERYSTYNADGVDIYAAGAGLTLAVIPSTDAVGILSYSGSVYVQADDTADVRVQIVSDGSIVDSATVMGTIPIPVNIKGYLVIPISGSISVSSGKAVSLKILGDSGVGAELISANFKYFYV
jgi:hypothetical protein